MGRFTPYSLSKYRFIHTFRVFIQCLGRIYSHSEWIFSQSPWKICFMLYCWFTDKLCLIIFREVCQFKIFSCTNVRSHNIHSGRRNEVNRDHASAVEVEAFFSKLNLILCTRMFLHFNIVDPFRKLKTKHINCFNIVMIVIAYVLLVCN